MLKNNTVRIKTYLKKGDLVQILTGKDGGARNPKQVDSQDLGKRGRIKDINYRTGRVTIEGQNMRKKAVRPDPQKNRPGGIIDVEGALHISNVMLVCPKCDRPRRIAVKMLKSGKKIRACKVCKSNIGEEY